MKLLKRIGSILLMLLLVFTMFPASTVLATELPKTGSLIMMNEKGDSVKSSSEYSAYQIVAFDASKDTDGNTFYTNMKINIKYKAVLMAAVGLTGSPTDREILTEIAKLDADKRAALAVELQRESQKYPTDAIAANLGVFAGLANGYYLVIETVNNASDGSVISKPILVNVPDSSGSANVTVNVKPSKADIEKKIVEKENGNDILVDSSTAAIGDTVDYQSLSDIPSYPIHASGVTYYVTDTFSQGLSFIDTSVKAYINKTDGTKQLLTPGTDYTLQAPDADGATFRLTLNNSSDIIAWGNAGSKLLVTYSARVNENAITGITGNPNSVKLTYSTVPGKYTTKEDTVITYTELLIVTKTEKGGSKALSGAAFELSKLNSSGTYDVIDTQITDGSGKVYFRKLEQGTYKLKETVAPAGYDILEGDTIFVVTAKNDLKIIPDTTIICDKIGNTTAANEFKASWFCNNNKFTVDADGTIKTTIENSKGFILPGTGGSGTKMFTICGIAIILLGCCMVFVFLKRRKTLKHQ